MKTWHLIRIPAALLCVALLASCATRELPAPSGKADFNNDYMVLATLWQQTAGETKALYLQSYRMAAGALDRRLAEHGGNKPPAIITDIDETVLDNSPYQARMIRSGKRFPEGWREWVAEARADALPGAVDFLRHADRRGVAIYYVSNRHVDEVDDTLRNFRRHGIPQAERGRLLFMYEDHSKQARIESVRRNHEVLLLVGDQLGDFGGKFDRLSVRDRNRRVMRNREQFGDRFIMLPNPMYGGFEQAVYNYRNLTPAEAHRARLSALSER